MITVDVPAGEQVVLRLPHGEEITVYQDGWHDTLKVRLSCALVRRLRFMWLPSHPELRARETLLVEAYKER